jgi:hypothetical protein
MAISPFPFLPLSSQWQRSLQRQPQPAPPAVTALPPPGVAKVARARPIRSAPPQ